MSDENAKLSNEISDLKKKLDKVDDENAELTKQNNKMKEQNAKLLEKIEKMEEEKFQQKIPTQQVEANSNLEDMLEEKSKDLEEKMDEKSPKLLKRKSVSNWLIDSLPWIKRKELADSKLSTSCEIFRQLCWPKLHGNVKPHNIDYLLVFGFQYNETNGIYQGKLKGWKEKNELEYIEWDIPIASIQPPNYITGFDKIRIHFLNGQIMQFIECIYSKLNGFCLTLDSIEVNICNSDDNFGQIQRLFKMLAKKAFSLGCGRFADFLRFNQNAFDLIENVQAMKEIQIYHQEEDIELLVKWLNKSLADDQKPKLLESRHNDAVQINLIEKIKEQFIGTSQPANFIISFGWGPADYPNFSMENDQTGEVLALYPNPPNANRHQWDYISRLFLIRHAKGEEQIKPDWEKQILQLEKLSLPYVIVGIAGIGEF